MRPPLATTGPRSALLHMHSPIPFCWHQRKLWLLGQWWQYHCMTTVYYQSTTTILVWLKEWGLWYCHNFPALCLVQPFCSPPDNGSAKVKTWPLESLPQFYQSLLLTPWWSFSHLTITGYMTFVSLVSFHQLKWQSLSVNPGSPPRYWIRCDGSRTDLTGCTMKPRERKNCTVSPLCFVCKLTWSLLREGNHQEMMWRQTLSF